MEPSEIKTNGRGEDGVVAQVLAVGWAVMAVVAVDALARAGWPLEEPRPLFLLCIIYSAAAGGVVAAAIAVGLTLAYSFYYFGPASPAVGQAPLNGTPQTIIHLIVPPLAALLVLMTRRRSRHHLRRALEQERGRSDRQAAGSSELNQAVLSSLSAHIAVLDRQGRIVATNSAWDEFARQGGISGTAAPASTQYGASYLAVCRNAVGADAEQARAVADGIEAVLRGEKSQFQLEYPCHSPTQQRWFLLTVSPLAGNAAESGGGGVVVSHLDITERKASEQAVRQRAAELAVMTRDLKRTNAELDQFAYITSHDLRAPLRGIANLSQWIEEDLPDGAPPETKRQLELLRGRVSRMEAMIDGILQYSRVGRVQTEVRQVDVGQLVAESVDLLDIPPTFTIDVQAEMPVLVTEPLRLQQVFMNLLGNAVKHHDKQRGTIRIGWRDAGDGFVEFSVSDDGPGIEPQYHEKVFVMFQTLQPRDRVEGTGVGLALVQKIVENMGGVITLESEPGNGTTFRFTWPRGPAAAGAGVGAGAAREAS